jgi:ficolin
MSYNKGVTGEYWLGLKYINILTTIGSALYIEIETFELDNVSPASAFAEYSTFKVNDETDKYKLTVAGFYGNCFDCLNVHNGMRFTTFDNDNDLRGADNCAVMFHGGWWYTNCHETHLNGLYLGGAGSEFGKGITW